MICGLNQRILSIFFLSNLFCQGDSWDCHNFDAWEDVAPICITGQKQSPIDLRPDVLGQDDKKKPSMQFMNYDEKPLSAKVSNDGHSVEFDASWPQNPPSITGPEVFSNEKYIFDNAHLHWSIFDDNGTEHSIKGERYATELHLLHYNQKYQNFSNAGDKPDGLAVIAVLYEVNEYQKPNKGMEVLASYTESITDPNDSKPMDSLNLSWFFPDKIKGFYSYSGSLTTPPCTENVRWIVISEPQPITSEIIEAIRDVDLDNFDFQNVRPLQKANNRLVEFYHLKK